MIIYDQDLLILHGILLGIYPRVQELCQYKTAGGVTWWLIPLSKWVITPLISVD